MTENVKKPIKRHENLKPLSRDHHHGLLLCWKIRTGLTKNIAMERIVSYLKFFFSAELEPHFLAEEKDIFTLLPSDHPMIKRAIEEHAELRSLAALQNITASDLLTFVNKLNAHIRFEERELFQEIERTADKNSLQQLHLPPHQPVGDNYHDPFWL